MPYFVRQTLSGRRYYLGELDRKGVMHVDRVQASRPDGDEIAEPARVQMHTSTPREQMLRNVGLAHADPLIHRRQIFHMGVRPDHRRCARCEQQKPLHEFYLLAGLKGRGRGTVCKTCTDAGEVPNRGRRRIPKQEAA